MVERGHRDRHLSVSPAFWLSLVIATGGCAGLLLAGRGMWQGWALGLAVQPVWAVFAVVTEAYGLLITCLMYGAVYSQNLLKWRRQQREERCDHDRSYGVYGDEALSAVTACRPYRACCPDCGKRWNSIAAWEAERQLAKE